MHWCIRREGTHGLDGDTTNDNKDVCAIVIFSMSTNEQNQVSFLRLFFFVVNGLAFQKYIQLQEKRQS